MKKEVGRVSAEERDEIQKLFERMNGLRELAASLTADNTELYERMVADMGTTSTRFENWWHEMSAKYDWERSEDGHWEIDFNDGTIFLVTPE